MSSSDALAFLEDSLTDQEQPPAEFRLQWAQGERQAVVNTLELERMRYRVANTVGDAQEKQTITQRVQGLLARLDVWNAIIGEIDNGCEESMLDV